jgi:Fe-S cluster assembly protein SufD
MIEQAKKRAQQRIVDAGLPKPGEESWRFSPLSSILDKQFAPALSAQLSGGMAASLYLAPISCYRLVFHNGKFVEELSRLPQTGFKCGSLVDGVDETLLLGADEKGFGALAASKFQDGPYVVIPKGLKVDKPIHVVYVGTATAGKPQEAHYRGVFVLGAGASAVVVEESVGRAPGEFFTNSVSRFELGENAQLEHYTLLREPDSFVGVRDFRAALSRSAGLKSHCVALGGALQRCDSNVRLNGEGAEAELNGLYLAGGKQHFDFHTNVVHAKPHGTSRELYKGVLDGKARAVFNGMIEVEPNAQKTDANVYNKNLLLSEDGMVNTKPEFKIHANDVQCKHGATIGQLREDALFYLRSRGIGLVEARSLLVFAFASEMLGRMSLEPVREALSLKIQSVTGLGAKTVAAAAPEPKAAAPKSPAPKSAAPKAKGKR